MIGERLEIFGIKLPFSERDQNFLEKGGRLMSHGPHHDCLMCSMAKTVGMMEKHPKDCACEAHPKKKDEQKDESKISTSLGM